MFVIIWICLGIVGAMISNKKGNSSISGFALGILLGPVGLLIALFSSDNEQVKRERTGHTKKCPYCAEYIKYDAIVCRYCGRELVKDSDSKSNNTSNYFNDNYKTNNNESFTHNNQQIDTNISQTNSKGEVLSNHRITKIILTIITILILVTCLVQFNKIKQLKYQYPFGWFNFQHAKIDSILLANNITSIYDYQFRVDRNRKAKFLVACKLSNVVWEYYVLDLNRNKFHKIHFDNTIKPPLIKPSRRSKTNNQQILSKPMQKKMIITIK